MAAIGDLLDRSERRPERLSGGWIGRARRRGVDIGSVQQPDAAVPTYATSSISLELKAR